MRDLSLSTLSFFFLFYPIHFSFLFFFCGHSFAGDHGPMIPTEINV